MRAHNQQVLQLEIACLNFLVSILWCIEKSRRNKILILFLFKINLLNSESFKRTTVTQCFMIQSKQLTNSVLVFYHSCHSFLTWTLTHKRYFHVYLPIRQKSLIMIKIIIGITKMRQRTMIVVILTISRIKEESSLWENNLWVIRGCQSSI